MSLAPLIAVNAALVGDRPMGLAACVVNLVTALDRLGERLAVVTSRPEVFWAGGFAFLLKNSAAYTDDNTRHI